MTRQRILVGIDGSPEAEHALAWTIEDAKRRDAEIIAVHVFEPPLYPVTTMTERILSLYREEWREPLRRVLETEWCKPLRDAALPYRAELLEGPVADALIHASEEFDVDLIVVGQRAGAAFHGLTLGTVAERIARRAGWPVVAIPHRSA